MSPLVVVILKWAAVAGGGLVSAWVAKKIHQAIGFGKSKASPEDQARYAARFCRAYGFAPGPQLLDTVADRLMALLASMRARAAAGDTASQAHIAAGHPALYEEDIRYLQAQRDRLLRAFAR